MKDFSQKDLRVVKSHKALVTAMFSLLEKNSFTKITVNDLCTHALVSRSTFYTYFEDKYDLLRFCLNILIQKLFQHTKGLPTKKLLRHILVKIQENVSLFKHLLMDELDGEVVEIIRSLFHQYFEHFLLEHQVLPTTLSCPLEIVSMYYTSAITSVIMLWIGKRMVYTVDEMTNFLSSLLPAFPDEEKTASPQQ